MSSVSSAASSPAYFQSAQTTPDKASPDNASPSAAASPQASPAVAAKVVETASTRNGDGTFGPKHTIHPPGNYTNRAKVASPTADTSDAVSTVNVKV